MTIQKFLDTFYCWTFHEKYGFIVGASNVSAGNAVGNALILLANKLIIQ